MTSPVPPRDWTDIHWPDIAAADAARWIAVLPLAATEQHGPHLPLETDVMIGEAYLARVRELLPPTLPVDLPAAAAGRHFHRTYRLSGHADAVDRGRAEGLDGARRKRRARRHQKARDGDEPWRQQRRDDAGRAGFARATRAARRSPRAGRASARRTDCSRPKNCATAFMAARSKPRSCWRDIRTPCARRRSPIFVPRSIAMEKEYRWLSTQRPAPFAWQAQDLHPSGAVGDATQGLRREGREAARPRRPRVLRIARRRR